MEMNKYVTTINNKRIYDYYKSNTNVNIESMNLIMLDFMEQLGNDMTKVKNIMKRIKWLR